MTVCAMASPHSGIIRQELQGASERLRISTSELKAFGCSVSHELRTSLRAGSQGCSRMRLEICGDQLDDKGHDDRRVPAPSWSR